MNRVLRYDQIDFSPVKITQRDDPIFGPTTIFHDIVIAREIIHQYEDGWAYKPAKELKAAAWTATDRWVVIGRHPDTAIVSSRGDIGGRTTNIRYTKSLIDPKTQRPNNHGVLADIEVFDNKVAPDVLAAMKSGSKSDVSIGFFFDQDVVAGTIDEDGHPLNGATYDYVQRNIMIDHTAAALDTGSGRCAMPYCGIGADAFKRLVIGDPFAGYEDFADCVAKNQDKDDPDAYCASIKRKVEEARKKKGDLSIEEINSKIEDLKKKRKSLNEKIDTLYAKREKRPEDKLWDEIRDLDDEISAYLQAKALKLAGSGDAGPRSEAERAMAHFNISEEEWAALSDEEKQDYISKLPKRGTKEEDHLKTENDQLITKNKKLKTENRFLWESLGRKIHNKNDLTRDERFVDKLDEEDFKPISGDTLSMKRTIDEAKVYLKDVLSKLDSIEFVEDDLVEEEYQGNAASITLSKRAQMHFSIPEDEWEGLSEAEKLDYISRLPPEKQRAGEEEMSDRDCTYEWEDVKEKLLNADKLELVTLSQLIGEMKLDGESVTISAETIGKLKELLDIDIEPCEPDEDIDEEIEEVADVDEDEVEVSEPEKEKDAKSAGQVLKDFERVWRDKELIIG